MCEYCGDTVVEEREMYYNYYDIAMRPRFDNEYHSVCLATITGPQEGHDETAEREIVEHGGIGAWVMVVDAFDYSTAHCVDFCPKCGRKLN